MAVESRFDTPYCSVMKQEGAMKIIAKARPRKKSVHIRLDPAIHQQAHQLAETKHQSFSQYVEKLIEQHVQGQIHKPQQVNDERQELLTHIESGETHGIWSVYDEFEAAEQLQAVLNNTPQ